MDLMKLLRLRKKEPTDPGWLQKPGSAYLIQLARILRHDIGTLAESEGDEDWIHLSQIMRVYTGHLSEKADPEVDGYNYVFLNVPNMRGFMLELTEDETALELRRGTLIVPLKRNAFDELESSTLFVTSPQLLGSFQILGPDLVRGHEPVTTYPVEAMSERLLSLAFGLETAGGKVEPKDDQESSLKQGLKN